MYRRDRSDYYDPKYAQGITEHPDTFVVWDCLSYSGVGELVVIPRNIFMNKNNYFLLDHLPDSLNFFLQDGASCLMAKDMIGRLQD